MSETTLTQEKILEVAEDVLRRYGPAKATVVDVARALGVSHGSVYRHFASKADLRDAVTQVWLERFLVPLEAIVLEDASAADRLHRWLREVSAAKRRRLSDDPELFATYCVLTAEARKVVGVHVDHLASQVTQLLQDGNARREWNLKNPAATSRAVLSATARFHNPVHASEWADPNLDNDFREVWLLLLKGLKTS